MACEHVQCVTVVYTHILFVESMVVDNFLDPFCLWWCSRQTTNAVEVLPCVDSPLA